LASAAIADLDGQTYRSPIPTYVVKALHLPGSSGFTATLIGGLILAIGCRLAGRWSNKLPRCPNPRQLYG
jgi:hypothetical protein